MICEICHQNEAIVRMDMLSTDGEVSTYICLDCVKKQYPLLYSIVLKAGNEHAEAGEAGIPMAGVHIKVPSRQFLEQFFRGKGDLPQSPKKADEPASFEMVWPEGFEQDELGDFDEKQALTELFRQAFVTEDYERAAQARQRLQEMELAAARLAEAAQAVEEA